MIRREGHVISLCLTFQEAQVPSSKTAMLSDNTQGARVSHSHECRLVAALLFSFCPIGAGPMPPLAWKFQRLGTAAKIQEHT